MKKFAKILLIFLLIIISIDASGKDTFENVQQDLSVKDAKKVFIDIEEGISSGNIDHFSNHFGDKTYLSLVNGYTGYFSSGQAYYVLTDLFKIYKPLSFKFVSKVSDSATPFASGVLRYSIRGIRSSAMVFISLKKSGNRWLITQITIN